jgi:nicotinamide-nucleotide amidase
MPERNRIQAMMPQGALILPNPNGTAAGFIVEVAEAAVAALPGVPHEMRAMFAEQVEPFLRKLPIPRKATRVERLRTFGLPESAVNEAISHLMERTANPLVGLLVSEGIITVKLTAAAESEDQAVRLIEPVRQEVQRILGPAIYGQEEATLEETVGVLLAERRKTLAVAESCTGGLIGHLLTNVPGISAVFLEGIVAYSNDAKIDVLGVSAKSLAAEGAVSKRVAASMARGARKRSGADFGLATTGIAGPTGGTEEKPVGLVYFGLATPEETLVERVQFVGARTIVKDRAARFALNMLRLHLLGQSEWGRGR